MPTDDSLPTVRAPRPLALAGDATRAAFEPPSREAPGPPGALPETIGRYPVHGELGRGGMGEVFEATDPVLGRRLAIKRLLGTDSGLARKFEIEARVTGQLEHPGIVPVYELGIAPDGRAFLAMRKIEGHTLAELVAAERDAVRDHRASPGPFPLPRRLEVYCKLCDAVAYAHARGVVHRDLKPANVMVGPFGEVLVLDWGLARMHGAPDERADAVCFTRPTTLDEHAPLVTLDGTVIGTPAYMSPEQARGELSAIDETSDVYSLGAILYTLLALAPPHGGLSTWATIDSVAMGRVAPLADVAATPVPWELEAIVLRAMAPASRDRYTDVAALRDDVGRWIAGLSVAAARYGTLRHLARWAIRHRGALAACALALATGGFVWLSREWRVGEARYAAISRAIHDARLVLEDPRVRPIIEGPPASDLRPERADRRDERLALVERHLAAALALERTLADGSETEPRRYLAALGVQVARLARAGGDHALARAALAPLAAHGIEAERVAAFVAELERDQVEHRTARAQRIAQVLADVAADPARADRAANAPTLSDYVFELVGYRETTTVAQLTAALEPVVAAHEGATTAPWSNGERALVELSARVLARLRLDEAVAALAAVSRRVREPALVAELGQALCDTRDPGAYAPLWALRESLGVDSATWQTIHRAIGRVPAPALRPEGAAGAARVTHLLEQIYAGEFATSIAEIEALLVQYPEHSQLLAARGFAWLAQGQAARALADLDRSIAIDANGAHAWNNRGRALAALGRVDEALASYARAIELRPAWTQPLCNRGSTLSSLGRDEEALADYERALALSDQDPVAWMGRGVMMHKRGNTAEALAAFDRALALDHQLGEAYLDRALAHQQAGDRARAQADLDKAAELRPRDARVYRCRGVLQLENGNPAGAAVELDRSLELDASDDYAHYRRAEAHLQLGQGDEALAAFSRAIARRERPEYYLERARLYARRGEFDRALTDVEFALSRDPANLELAKQRIQVYYDQGRRELALTEMERLVAREPNNAALVLEHAKLLNELGRRADADRMLDRALELDPTCARAWIQRGMHHQIAARNDRAIEAYTRAVEVEPSNWTAHATLGDLLVKLGRTEEGLTVLRRALELAPPSAHPQIRAAMGGR